jgi:hypothetical protein
MDGRVSRLDLVLGILAIAGAFAAGWLAHGWVG